MGPPPIYAICQWVSCNATNLIWLASEHHINWQGAQVQTVCGCPVDRKALSATFTVPLANHERYDEVHGIASLIREVMMPLPQWNQERSAGLKSSTNMETMPMSPSVRRPCMLPADISATGLVPCTDVH